MLGESSSGKTENFRMIINFLSKISGRFSTSFHRQLAAFYALSNNIKNSPKSPATTPKHKHNLCNTLEKSSCFKTSDSGKSKKASRVEFDFSYQKYVDDDDGGGESSETTTNNTKHDTIKFCPKHNCCNASSSSSNASNAIDIPIRKNIINDLPIVSKSFTVYETMNRVQNSKKLPNFLDHVNIDQPRCESLDLIKVGSQICLNRSTNKITKAPPSKTNSLDNNNATSSISSTKVYEIDKEFSSLCSRKNINLDNFKSAKRKVPIKNLKNVQLNNLEIQSMKEKIAQAEVFLEAMGNASTSKNRDSSRYVSP
jgi:myosin-1